VAKHQPLRDTRPDITEKRKPVAAEGGPEGQASYEMANLRPDRTGLPFVVFISQKGGARHDIRVKVAPGAKARPSEMVTVAIRPSIRVIRGTLDPRDLGLLSRWINLNLDTLIRYWDGDIEYTEDVIAAIIPVGTS
jgi:hypothetical protein